MDLAKITIKQVNEGLKNKEFSCNELSSEYLRRIDQVEDKVHAFITLRDKEDILNEAKKVDEKIASGKELNSLEGVLYSAKDIYCTKGIETTAGSKALEGYIPPYDSSVIKKFKKAGTLLVGKNTQDEFAQGASSENTGYDIPRNPWDAERVCGGSSGGSAAAVASQQVMFSIGTDTGGSIRQPASLCGLCGIKPTYGRVSRFGVVPMTSSLDTMGCFAKSSEDIAYILKEMAGQDKYDSTTLDKEVPDYPSLLDRDLSGLKVGMPKEYFSGEGVEDGVLKGVKDALMKMEEMGAKIVEISLPHTKYGVAAYYIICPSEVSANMARYDGVRFGKIDKGFEELDDIYAMNREKFHPEVKRRIMIGTYALSSGYYDAYYVKAQKIRSLVKQDFDQAFEQVDVIVTPTSPTVAFKIGEKSNDPLAMYLSDAFTIPANLAGICGLNVPCGMSEGLPVGLQILGNQFREDLILKVGDAYEKERGMDFIPSIS